MIKCVGPEPKFTKDNNHFYEIDTLLNYAESKHSDFYQKSYKFIEIGRIRERVVNNIEYIFFDSKKQNGKILCNVAILKNDYLKIEKSNNRYLKIKEILGDF